ncbi:5825_t:CDS:2 [Acaulospora morrowiae]|uniref:5825_t:CDS:1 n=1 Tax=Acaulospora morrowiae TaxID=94023 RepID=A0A9N9F8A8_9GLOM|nr:5825_t:CDS:2 [Acaulospora morrowiae]
MSFIRERVRELQSDLDLLYRSVTLNILDQKIETIDQGDVERAEAIKSAIQSVKLEEGKVPNLIFVITQLETLERKLYGSKKDGKEQEVPLENGKFSAIVLLLELIFLAKVTVAVYAKVMEHFLISTLPLFEDIYYWEKLHGSRFWTTIHMLQTLPVRVYSLLRASFNPVREQYQNVSLTNPLFPLRQYFTRDLFSTHIHTRISSLSTLSVLHLARREIWYKKIKLKSIMEYQAACLGFLSKEGLDFKYATENVEQLDAARVHAAILDSLTKCLILMERTLNEATRLDVKTGDVPSIKNITDDVKSPQNSPNFYERLRIVVIYLSQHDARYSRVIAFYGQPSSLVRWWIPFTISSILIYKTRRYMSQEFFRDWLEDLKTTVINFWKDWVWDPVKEMMDTIRHRESRLAIMGKESLNSDFESLERMVLDFAREQNFSPEELTKLSYSIKEGDLSMVLKIYEQELKSPFKSTLTGKLIRTLLIQVQKTKVDLELAMAALDKLLKSNELNFAFLAVGPSIFIVYLLFNWIKAILWRKERWTNRLLGTNVKMRESLRQVERLLVNHYRSPNTEIPFATHGLILCHVHYLRSYSSCLSSKNNLRYRFLDDLRDLDTPNMSIRQKIWTCERMWRCWGFLKSENE